MNMNFTRMSSCVFLASGLLALSGCLAQQKVSSVGDECKKTFEDLKRTNLYPERILDIVGEIWMDEERHLSNSLSTVSEDKRRSFLHCPFQNIHEISQYSKFDRNRYSVSFVGNKNYGFLMLVINIKDKNDFSYSFFDARP
jgi:hypothetical protein